MTPDTILDAEAVAEHLRCSAGQAKALMASDELPATKTGRGHLERTEYVPGGPAAECERATEGQEERAS